jgi:hypothetical protein
MVNRMIRITALFCGCALAGTLLAGNSDEAAVSQGLSSAMPVKLSVAEQFAKTGNWIASNAAAGLEQGSNGPTTVSVSTGGLITVTFNSPADLAGKSIVLTPSDGGNGQVNWACKASGAFPAGTLPKECQ